MSLSLHKANDFKVGKRPRMPCFIPGRVEVRGEIVRMQDIFYVSLQINLSKYNKMEGVKDTHQSPILRKFDLPFTSLKITTGKKL